MDTFKLAASYSQSFDQLSPTNSYAALINVYRHKDGHWASGGEKEGSYTYSYCREIFYTNHTSMLHTKGLLLCNSKLAVVINTFNKEKFEVALNVLNILEKRYKWAKTSLIYPEIVLVGKATNTVNPKKALVIFDSPENWLVNPVISSIYTLYIRAALNSNIYDKVKTFADIKQVNKTLVLNSRARKDVPISFTSTTYNTMGIKENVLNDHKFIIKTCLVWDFFIKNMKELLLNNVEFRIHGSNGIERLLLGADEKPKNECWKMFKNRVDYPKIRNFLLEQKLVKYKGYEYDTPTE